MQQFTIARLSSNCSSKCLSAPVQSERASAGRALGHSDRGQLMRDCLTGRTLGEGGVAAATKPAATVAILRIQTVRLGKQPKLHVTLRVSRASEVALTLVGSTGKVVARWNLRLTVGTRNLVLALPVKARHRGRDKLRVQIGNAKAETVTVILRP